MKAHHRRRVPGDEDALSFGKKCTADTLYARGERSRGMAGEKYAVVILDLGTEWCDCVPVCDRSSKDAEHAPRFFAGPGVTIGSFILTPLPNW